MPSGCWRAIRQATAEAAILDGANIDELVLTRFSDTKNTISALAHRAHSIRDEATAFCKQLIRAGYSGLSPPPQC